MPIKDDIEDYEKAISLGLLPTQALRLVFVAPQIVSSTAGWGNHCPDYTPSGTKWFCTCGDEVLDLSTLPRDIADMGKAIRDANDEHRVKMSAEFNTYLAVAAGPTLFDGLAEDATP